MTTNNRIHPRTSSLNLLSYFCIGEDNEVVKQGMGRTLNVSEGGILLETHDKIDSQYSVSLTIGLEDELMADINGKVVHIKKNVDDRYESGVQFEQLDEAPLKILKAYIKAFNEQQDD